MGEKFHLELTSDDNPVFKYARDGDLRSLEKCLKSGVSANSHSPDNIPLVYSAVNSNNIEMLRLLLQFGLNPNIKDSSGETIIFRAIERGYLEICSILLDAEADPNQRKDIGFTPTIVATKLPHDSFIEFVSHGGDCTKTTDEGDNGLFWCRDPNNAKFLLDAGVSPNSRNSFTENTALIELVCAQSPIEVIKVMLEAGADPTVEGEFSGPILGLTEDPEIIALLKKYGAK